MGFEGKHLLRTKSSSNMIFHSVPSQSMLNVFLSVSSCFLLGTSLRLCCETQRRAANSQVDLGLRVGKDLCSTEMI